jgi:glycosyltransferase involved in cell wall biosynthesis
LQRWRAVGLVPSKNAINATPVRVVLVAPSLTILGGQAVQADRLLRAWHGDPEITASLLPVNPAAPGPLGALQRIKFIRTATTQALYWPSLVAGLRRADVVHVFSASYSSFLLAPWPAVRIARLLGKPVLMNYRSGEAPDHLARSPLARRTLARVDLNVVPSTFLRDVFAGFGIRSRIIPNVVDLERFRFRERHPLRPRLVSTRNLEPLYNVACTLRAFRLVQDRYPDATLLLVGTGSEEPRLRALARSLRLEGVTFAGPMPQGEIWRAYDNADIYVQTSAIDNMPTSVLEAYASGLPVVATAAGGVPAILTDGEHGLLAPVDDHVAVAEAVLRLLADPPLAERLAAAAHGRARTCTWPAVRGAWTDAYRSVLRGRVPAVAAVTVP